jgi:hypothetical protein
MTTTPLPTIYFDTNCWDGHGYWLWLGSAEQELAAIDEPREGMRVRLLMPDEVEVEAHVRRADGRWYGVPVEGTWRTLG